MKKKEFNKKFRSYVKEKASPSKDDRKFISEIYKSFQDFLGSTKLFQTGSFSRFTAIKPLHDLDILYVLDAWDEQCQDSLFKLKQLKEKIDSNYKSLLNLSFKTVLQTHSVNICFKNSNNKEVFSIDIVPAYIFKKNEFNQDTYKVPEIIRCKHGEGRKKFYDDLSKRTENMSWICTDPKGYIKVAKEVNQSNNDFRKTVKFIKAWKNSCKEKDDDFKLKSFHIELVVTEYFNNEDDLDIFDGIFKFFVQLPEIIKCPKIKDRANPEKYIDGYLKDLTLEQREKIIQKRDGFLKKLENCTEQSSIEGLINACFYKRVSSSEKFLFDLDFKIPVLIENDLGFKIDGEIKRKSGFRNGLLSEISNRIAKGRKISFLIINDIDKDYTLWKVKNDTNSESIRGEITKDKTLNEPEFTAFSGSHSVECFAIKDGVCIGKSTVLVNID